MNAPLRIVDFSTHLPGPLASHLLKEMGADVIKIENPRHGDGNRGTPPQVNGEGMFHSALNAGTRSLAVDRHSELWREVIAASAQWADAVLVGGRVKDAQARGLDFGTFKAANPSIIYCSLSGYGLGGPWADYLAHGQNVDAYAGLVPTIEGEIQPTTRAGFRTVGSTLGGVCAAMAILEAARRKESGVTKAQFVGSSLWTAAMWWSWRDLAMLANTGEPWMDYADLGSRYSIYKTQDDREILLAPIERHFWVRFCAALELPESSVRRGDWRTGTEYGKGEDFLDERRQIALRVKERDLESWISAFTEFEIPFAPLLTMEEARTSEHARVNGVMRNVTTSSGTVSIPAAPVFFADQEITEVVRASLPAPPRIGEHTAEVLAEFGIENS